MTRITILLAIAGIGALLGVSFYNIASKTVAFDNTDNPPGRSGLRPHVDALTGCEYLSVWGGGITPRLDRNGRQICKDAAR